LPAFFAGFMALFFFTGVGNASTFQMIPVIMGREVPRLMPQPDRGRPRPSDRDGIGRHHRLHQRHRGLWRVLHPQGLWLVHRDDRQPDRRAVAVPGLLRDLPRAITWVVYTRPGGLLHDIERGRASGRRCPSRRITKGRHEPPSRQTELLPKQGARNSSRTGWGQTTRENRDWEDTYRNRWRHDKIVRSTHGVNCTGSCSWKIYVKSGIVTWETQQTDYPRTRPDLPNHEPRGCARGASYSWYLYSANRVKNPLIRGALMRPGARCGKTMAPVAAWAAIQNDPGACAEPAIPRRAARAALCAPPGTRRPRSSPPPMPIPPRPMAPTGCSASRRSPPCRWSAMPPARAICRCSAAPACRSTTGIATCRPPRRRPGANRPTCPKAPTGTTPAS
jgi:hypothetical protein